MKKEDKELLLKDLSARLTYGVYFIGYKVVFGGTDITIFDKEKMMGMVEDTLVSQSGSFSIEKVRPYLLPMSSMTEEEKLVYEYYEEGTCNTGLASELIDWLNKNMFDYRGLISKGLALKAPKDMYGQRYFPDEFSSYEDYVKYLKEKGLAI